MKTHPLEREFHFPLWSSAVRISAMLMAVASFGLLRAKNCYAAPVGSSNSFTGLIKILRSLLVVTVVFSAAPLFFAQTLTISGHPQNIVVTVGQQATFTVAVTGTPAPTYQWKKNGTNIANATGATLTLTNVQLADSGSSYTVTASNGLSPDATSNVATLTVNPVPPAFAAGLATTATAVQGRNFFFPVAINNTAAAFTATGLAGPGGTLVVNPDNGSLGGAPANIGTFTIVITATNSTNSVTHTLSLTVQAPPPVITSAASTNGRVNSAFSFTVVGSNTPTSYAATGLPGGLSINTSTGVISGTPSAAGTFTVGLTATNGSGSITQPFVITIDPPLNAPVYAGTLTPSGTQVPNGFSFTPAFGTVTAPYALASTLLDGVTPATTANGLLAMGLTFNPTTGAIAGTPNQVRTFKIVLQATNAGGTTAVELTLVINPAPSAPVITSASTAPAARVGTAFSFTLTSAGTPAASSYSATGLPAGLSLNAATGAITGTPTAFGFFDVSINATNSVGTGPTSILSIFVAPSAIAPVITSAPVAPGQVGQAFSYTLTGSNSPVSFQITFGTLPAGLSLNAITGAITGTPSAAAFGETRVWFNGTSGTSASGLSLEVLFTIAPTPTTPIVNSNGTATAQVGQPFQYAITASSGAAITGYGATGRPAWLALDPATGVLSGIPTEATTTPISIGLTASNGDGASNLKTLVLIVTSAPATPVIASALAASGRVGTPFAYQIGASESPMSYAAIGVPPGLSLNSTTGAITGTPSVSNSFDVTLRAANSGGLGATSTLTIDIAPAVAAPAITSAASASGQVGTVFSYQIVATNGPIISYGLTGTLPLGLSLNTSTGAITGTPAADPRVYTVQLAATNASGTSFPQPLSIVLAPALGVPALTTPLYASGTVGVDFSFTITATNLTGSAPYAPPILLDAVNLPAGLAVNPATGVIQGKPTSVGTTVASLTATNAAGTCLTRNLSIAIQPAPSAPVIGNPGTAFGRVGQAFSYQIVASNNPTALEVLGAPAWMTINNQTGTFGGTPTAPGTFTLRIVASNAAGASTPVTLTLTVAPAVGSSVITSSRTATGTIGSAFSYRVVAIPAATTYFVTGLPAGLALNNATGFISGTPTASGKFNVTMAAGNASGVGAPATLVISVQASMQLSETVFPTAQVGVAYSYQVLTNPAAPAGAIYTATGLPAGLAINLSTGLITGTPVAAGPFNGAITLLSGNSTNTFCVLLNVNPAPGAPAITSATTASGTVGTAFTAYTVTASNSPASFNIGALPAGFSIGGTATAPTVFGTPTTSGTYQVALSANNAASTGVTTLLTITIAPAAGTPVISSTSTATVATASAFAYQIAATNTPTSYSASGLPFGLSLNTTSGAISGTATVPGIYNVGLTASNATGTSASFTLALTVGGLPSISSGVTASGNVGSEFDYTITATNAPTSFNVGTLPLGLTVNTTTGAIVGTPTTAGVTAVTISANNAAGSGAAFNLTITVSAAGSALTITAQPASVVVSVGQNATFTVSATGTVPLSYQWRRNGYPISGATNASYTRTTAQQGDIDFYDVVVANSVSSVTSAAVRLGVAPVAYPGTLKVDPAFNLSAESDLTARANVVVPYKTTQFLVAGDFIRVAGNSGIRRIARFNNDGTLDPSFVVSINNTVNAVVVQPDDKIVIGGNFTYINGVSRQFLARLNVDGSVDPSFNSGSGPLGTVTAIVRQPDGKLIVGGSFSSYGGSTANRVVRLNADGTRDTTFLIGSTQGVNGQVTALALDPVTGKVVFGGMFTAHGGGASLNRIARFNPDGTNDTTFAIGTGFDSTVYALAVDTSGNVLVGGYFTSYNGSAANVANRLVRLLSTGSIDPAFTVGTGANAGVTAVAFDSANTRWLIGGDFTSYNGTSINRLARLGATGVLDPTFADPNVGGTVYSIFVQPANGAVVSGGTYGTVGGQNVRLVSRVTNLGVLDPAVNIEFRSHGSVNRILPLPGGKLLVGGTFTHLGTTPAPNLARLNANLAIDPTASMGSGANGAVLTAELQGDGKIVIGGKFTSYNGVTANRVARLNSDLSLDPTFDVGIGPSVASGTAAVNALAVIPGGGVYVGGNFNNFNDSSPARASVVRLGSDGTLDSAFNAGATAFTVYALAGQPTNGRVLVGGSFTNTVIGGQACNNLVRLNTDGSLDSTFPVAGANGAVYSIVLQPDRQILIGGSFTTYSGATINRLARLNFTDGTLDSTFGIGTTLSSTVYSILRQEDANLLLFGAFSTFVAGAPSTTWLGRVNSAGAFDTSVSLLATNFGMFSPPASLQILDDGSVLIGTAAMTLAGLDCTGLVHLISAVPPTVTSISANAVRPGATLTITGSNFNDVTAVRFNGGSGLAVTNFTVISPTSINVTVPIGAVSGPVTVQTASGSATSAASLVVAPDFQVRNPRHTAGTFNSIARGNGIYVAVGSPGDILSSTDAISWTPRYNSGSAATALRAVTFANTLFVAVGDSGRIMTSSDGITWTQRVLFSTNTLYGVTFGAGKFLAVSSSSTVATSTDGLTWTALTSTGGGSANAVTFGGSQFVAVGSSGAIRTSPDGLTWTTQTSGTANALNGVTFSGTQYVAVGSASTLLTSPDALTWTVRSAPTGYTTVTLYSAIFAGNKYVAVGSGGVLTSADGITWTGTNSLNDGGGTDFRGVLHDGLQYVGAGFLGIGTSADAVTWTLRNASTRIGLSDVAYGNGRFVAVGSGSSTFATSSDGVTWTAGQFVPGGPEAFNDVTYGNGLFVAVGNSAIYSSADGANWANATPGGTFVLNGVAFGGGAFVTVGNTGTIYRSTDGATWAPVTAITPATTANLIGVVYGNGGFVAVGAAGAVLTSSDGTAWTATAAGTSQLNGVTYSGTQFVAVGASSAVFTSGNGTTWTSRTLGTTGVNLTDVAYGDGFYVATNSSQTAALYVSTDGITWGQANLTSHVLAQSSVGGVVYGNGRFVVVSQAGLIVSSNPANDAPLIATQVVASRELTAGTVATAFSPVSAAGGTAPYLFAVSPALPAGLMLNSATGQITGTPVGSMPLGTYTISVTDNVGATATQTFNLTVLPPPTITAQPTSQTVTAGQSVTFNVVVTGTAPLIYVWKKDGTAISSATNASYTISSVQTSDAGSYTVTVSNTALPAGVTSTPAILTVNPSGGPLAINAPTIYANAAADYRTGGTISDTYGSGSWTYFASTTVNPGVGSLTALTYQQVGDGGNSGYGYTPFVPKHVPAVSRDKIFVDGVAPASNVELAWHPGQGSSSSPKYTVMRWTAGSGEIGPVQISGYLSRVGEPPSGDVDFHIFVNGSEVYSLSDFSTETASSFSVSNTIVPGQTIEFVLGYGTDEYFSDETLISASITNRTQPANQTVTVGQPMTLSVAAAGTGPLTFQWRRNGLPVTGATNASYTIASAQQTDSDYYDVVVSDSVTSVTSNTARVSVVPAAYPQGLQLDPTFTRVVERELGTIYQFIPIADGKFYVFGDFTRLNGVPRFRVARFNADGSLDAAFSTPYIDATVRSAALQSDGKLVIGGDFNTIGGLSRNKIGRLNSDGSLDTSFVTGTGASSAVNALAIQSDGKIVIGGAFVSYNGVSRVGLARLTTSGALDPGYNASLSASAVVNAVLLLGDDRLVVGGTFTTAGGTARANIAMLTSGGALDTSFDPGAGAIGGSVTALGLDSSSRIVLGGNFTSYAGASINRLARVSLAGAVDGTFVVGTGVSGTVNAVLPVAGGGYIIGGVFTTYNGTTRNNIAKIGDTGTVDFAFDPGANSTVLALAFDTSGNILAGGGFWNLGGQSSNGRFGRLAPSGTVDSALVPTIANPGTVAAMALQPGGKILVAGNNSNNRRIDNVPVPNNLDRLNADGTLDSTFNAGGAGLAIPSSGATTRLLVLPDGRTYVGGLISTYNGTARTNLLRINADGTLDPAFNPGTGPNAAPNVLLALPGGQLLIAGAFTSYNGVTCNGLARVNADGSLDTTFVVPSAAVTINSAVLLPTGKIIVGGSFTSYSGTTRNRLARLNADGTLDSTWDPGVGASGTVQAITLALDERIYIGGDFTNYAGTARLRIARLNADATLDPTFGTATSGPASTVSGILVQADGKVIVRGAFTGIPGTTVAQTRFLARFNADGSADTTFAIYGQAVSSSVNDIVVLDDGRLLQGLSTHQVMTNGDYRLGLARYVPAQLPAITAQPAGLAVSTDGSATFSVVATGDPAPAYQWFKDSTAIAGATNATLTLGSVQAADAGSYTVVVTNMASSLTSSAAILTVNPSSGTSPTVSLTNPANGGTAVAGTPVSLVATAADADGSIASVEFFANTSSLGSVTTAPYGISWTPTSAGSYALTARATDNSGLTTISSAVSFTVTAPVTAPVITSATAATATVGTIFTYTIIASNSPTSYAAANLPPGLTTAAATGAISGTPTTAGTFAVSLTATNASGTSPAVTLTITVNAVAVAPIITTQPVKQQVGEGGTVTLTVTAAGAAPLSYQWKKGTVALVDGGRVSGATTATLTISGALPADSGSYSVVVTNSADSVTSTIVVVGVVPSGTGATHAVVGIGYNAGGTVTITNTVTYTGTSTGLIWHVLLPEGWSYASSAGPAGETKPAAGATSLLDWVYTTVPTSPVTFSYTLNVPLGTTGTKTLTGMATLTQNGVGLDLLAQPEPLPVAAMIAHRADTDKNSRISLVELTRVIELYNTRLGTLRTGRYLVQAGTEDGFAPDPVSTSNQILSVYHSGDCSPQDGRITLTELTRVIELYNYRTGTVRTGQYHVQAGTEDGFGPGP